MSAEEATPMPEEPVVEPSAEAKATKKKKKKQKKKKKNNADVPPPLVAMAEDNEKTKEELLQALLGNQFVGLEKDEAALAKEHRFWSTQPVPQHGSEVKLVNEPIEVKTVDQVRQEPFSLPKGFAWCSCDMTDSKVVDEVYTLLYQNYVEDDDNMFRFDYSREFLQWALLPPGFDPNLHVGVRLEANNTLMGFITGIPAHIRVNGQVTPMVEINFLCVHKKLRSKRLAPVLIKEVTRRTNLKNVWQAVYTAGVVLPKPVAKNRYYHRSLNPKKLIDIGFSRLAPRMTMQLTIKLYRTVPSPQVPGIRPLEAKDCEAAHALLTNYLLQFNLHQVFSLAEFKHCFMSRDNVVNTYVVEDPETHEITDMCSFYTLPSTIIGHERYNNLKAAYSFYNVAKKTKWTDLMADALYFAKQLKFDVFNALNVMENDTFLKDLKFGIGDGHLQYYIYNWSTPQMKANQVGLVLL
jgi:glycylpeptide N-tetradecanoyltransferase